MRKQNLFSIMAALGAAAFLLTGCGAGTGESSASQSQSTEEVTAQAQSGTVSMESSTEDSTTENTQEPSSESSYGEESVVASSVAVVEILDALGVPMTGVPTSSYDLPKSVEQAARIGNPMSPDMEIIASLNPDVVVSVDTLSEELTNQFTTIGAESFFVNLSSYDGLKESITSLGSRFGKETQAAELINGFEEKETAITEKIADREGPSVLIIFGASNSFMVASQDSYVGDLVQRAGGVNIIQDAPSAFSPVDMEYLADKNPDYILFMAHANPEESLKAFQEEFETNAAWQNFDAVKNQKVVALETGYFGMSANLQAIDALEKLVDIFYVEK